ncbi:hypothetical protein L208DRAFT_735197 [Tricholoma matsutake]|nr:hypothetical protein L208DRAFT_735197 [Tricholoma matsutake 945]
MVDFQTRLLPQAPNNLSLLNFDILTNTSWTLSPLSLQPYQQSPGASRRAAALLPRPRRFRPWLCCCLRYSHDQSFVIILLPSSIIVSLLILEE